MGDQLRSGVIAILAGGVVAVALFVPFVAVSYRRRGRLTVGRLLLWVSAAVYFWAIWTYTLLPLPDPATLRCAGVNLDPLEFLRDVRGAIGRPGPLLTDPAVLQLVLNVVLFVPLGVFLRVLGGRGILVAGVVGLATSVFIETTQLTGVWGIYPCAYRVFDVVDMMTNTAGALIGSIAALAVPSRMRGSGRVADADLPRPVTRRRRALGVLCDALGMALTIGAVGVLVQAMQYSIAPGATPDGAAASVIGTACGVVVWLTVILVTGRSIGDLAVRVRFGRGRLPEPVARITRFALGVGGCTVLVSVPVLAPLAWLFALVSLTVLFVYRDGRGLPGWVGGRAVVDDRVSSGTPAPRRPGSPRRA